MFDILMRKRAKYLSRPVSTIVEIGSMDCKETVMFARKNPQAKIYTFECNPATIPDCKKAIKDFSNIQLIESAIADKDGKISFFPIDTTASTSAKASTNPGASSLFKFQEASSFSKGYVQNTIEVKAMRMKSFIASERIEEISALWMDIQGAELIALKSADEDITKIDAMLIEVEFKEIYANQPLFPEVKSFLNSKGFYLTGFANFTDRAGDAIFINSSQMRTWMLPIAFVTDNTLYGFKISLFLIKKAVRKTLFPTKR